MNGRSITLVALIAFLTLAATVPVKEPVTLHISLDAQENHTPTIPLPQLVMNRQPLELRIVPESDVGGEVTGWDVVLHRVGRDENLLAPIPNWHGLQDFMIGTWDVEGAPIAPLRRVIDQHGFRCVIEILGGKTRASETAYRKRAFESLELSIEITPKPQDAQKGSRTPPAR